MRLCQAALFGILQSLAGARMAHRTGLLEIFIGLGDILLHSVARPINISHHIAAVGVADFARFGKITYRPSIILRDAHSAVFVHLTQLLAITSQSRIASLGKNSQGLRDVGRAGSGLQVRNTQSPAAIIASPVTGLCQERSCAGFIDNVQSSNVIKVSNVVATIRISGIAGSSKKSRRLLEIL